MGREPNGYRSDSIRFDKGDVELLTNGRRLPFVLSAACSSGDFAGYRCFAEKWLSPGSGPKHGAIAMLACSIDESMNAIKRGQAQIVCDLVHNPCPTIGGQCFGSLAQCTTYDYGEETYETWHLFGDSTLQLRTAVPMPIDDSQLPVTLPAGMDPVEFHTDPGINIGIVTLNDGDCQLIGSGSSGESGNARVTLTESLAADDQLLITLSGRNRTPVQRYVTVE